MKGLRQNELLQPRHLFYRYDQSSSYPAFDYGPGSGIGENAPPLFGMDEGFVFLLFQKRLFEI